MLTRCILTALAAALVSASAQAQQVRWNLPSAYPSDNFHSENLVAFGNDVAAATGGKLQVTAYTGASSASLLRMRFVFVARGPCSTLRPHPEEPARSAGVSKDGPKLQTVPKLAGARRVSAEPPYASAGL